jgi:hypothetical protein
MEIFIVDKQRNKHHVAPTSNDGRGTKHLEEPVPAYPRRKGDHIIQPKVDNNTMIIMGRDRNTFGPDRNVVPHGSEENPAAGVLQTSHVSGFSDHMGAGAIDIVVGRGAPFALKKSMHGIYPQGLPPLYKTRRPPTLNDRLTVGSHPGFIMDAARIYISQMCQVDDYFGLKKVKVNLAHNKVSSPMKEDKGPCSAIMLKADKLRLHSRRDIYIVAGGDVDTTHDSNNYKINESGRIHLVVKNGQSADVRPTTPAVRYNELKMCIDSIAEAFQDTLEIINNVVLEQKQMNERFASSIYGTATGMSTQDPIAQARNMMLQLSFMTQLTQINLMKMANIPFISQNYVSDEGGACLASRHVTLN